MDEFHLCVQYCLLYICMYCMYMCAEMFRTYVCMHIVCTVCTVHTGSGVEVMHTCVCTFSGVQIHSTSVHVVM